MVAPAAIHTVDAMIRSTAGPTSVPTIASGSPPAAIDDAGHVPRRGRMRALRAQLGGRHPNRICLLEIWGDADAYEGHKASEHGRTFTAVASEIACAAPPTFIHYDASPV